MQLLLNPYCFFFLKMIWTQIWGQRWQMKDPAWYIYSKQEIGSPVFSASEHNMLCLLKRALLLGL